MQHASERKFGYGGLAATVYALEFWFNRSAETVINQAHYQCYKAIVATPQADQHCLQRHVSVVKLLAKSSCWGVSNLYTASLPPVTVNNHKTSAAYSGKWSEVFGAIKSSTMVGIAPAN